MLRAQVFANSHQETTGARGRVADDIGRLGRGHLHHEPDDVARGAELAFCPALAILPSIYS